MKVVTLKVEPREPSGKSGARRTRRGAKLPGVVYGEGERPRHIALDTKTFRHALEHGARVLDLEMEGFDAARALRKDRQWDAIGARLLHADFLRLNPEHELELNVPITFDGTPAGVLAGGVLNVPMDALPVRCLPQDIPEGFTVRIGDLQMGDAIHARDIEMPPKVALATDPDSIVVMVLVPRGADEDTAAAEGEDEGEPGETEGDGDASADSDED